MARFKEVIDECLAVAQAFTDISSDTYNELGAIDFEDNDKVYPFFLLDKGSISGVVNEFTRTGLPKATVYTQTFYFFNTYTELEKLTVTLQEKEDALKEIADKYFAELRRRNESGINNFFLANTPSFNVIDDAHNERVVQISYTVDIQTMPDDCALGTFSYAGVEAPTNLVKTSNTDAQIVISWTDNATTETAYEVWRSLDCENFTLLDTIAADSITYTDTGLTSETVYIYKVRATTATDNGKFSNILATCTDNTTTPAADIAYLRFVPSGQITSYRTGDDPWQHINAAPAANPIYPIQYAQLDYGHASPFFNLVANNIWGNKNRFTDELGTQSYTNNLIVCHLTGKMIYRIANTTGITWNDAIDNPIASSQGGYNNWYCPKYEELAMFVYGESAINNTFNYSPLNLTSTQYYWSSTTRVDRNTAAMMIRANNLTTTYGVKTSTTYNSVQIRQHL